MKQIDKILLGVLACALTLTLIACMDLFVGAEEYTAVPPPVCTEAPRVLEIVTPEPTPEPERETVTMLATAYCGCAQCCGKSDCITATGTRATEGRTIAADPHVLPFWTHVVIDGTEYVVEDCGSGINGNRLDIYFESHQSALEYGVKTVEVQIMEVENES